MESLPGPLLRRSSLRYLGRHPLLMGLSILGIALGVALVVSIDLANDSARRAFALSAERVTGKATHQVVSTTGRLPADVYRTLRIREGIREIAPVVEGHAAAPGFAGRTFQVLGIDPFSEGPFRGYTERGTGFDLGRFMATPGAALLAAGTADALGKAVGDTMLVRIGGSRRVLHLVGVLDADDERSASAITDLMIVDVSTAQEWFGFGDGLSHIDLVLPDTDAGVRRLAAIEAALPPGAQVVRSAARTSTIEQLTRAFELNLTALSLLALVVGVFLVYNTMTFSVVQRRNLIGRLRTLGVSRGQVFGLVLGEAVLVGILGTALGLVLGVALGQNLVKLVTRTINDLYYVLSVQEVALSVATLMKGVGLGLVATVAASIGPAREAATAPAGTVLRRSDEELAHRARLPRLVGAGAGAALVGLALLLVPGNSIVVSYTAMFFLMMAFALAAPAAVAGMARLARPPLGALLGFTGRMAAQGIVSSLSRTGVAIAALMMAVASTIGVGVMVGSFRQTVEVWLERSLQADIYISPPSLVMRRAGSALPEAFVEDVRAFGVARSVSTGRPVQVRGEAGPVDLVAFDLAADSRPTFAFKQGRPEAIWPAFDAGEAVLVSEPFTFRQGVQTGDSLRLLTDAGWRTFPVAGVFYDYGSDIGVVFMARTTFDRYYDDRSVTTMALYLQEGASLEVAIDGLRALAPAGEDILIRSNRTLRALSMEVFDRTFAITSVLQLLAIGVAFIGILSALMALQLERNRELAVLRATGFTPGQVFGYVTLQTGLMGLFAGVLALPLGGVLASMLVFVINRRSFGWTMQFTIPPTILVQAIVLAVLAAWLAGLYPSWRMSRANPSLALRED
ncbi:MAG: FtsX-like permease family protein [Rhodothermales bacterium]|nr:FtsX-like permease family protein [Rhodothermales bacterium]